MSATSVAPDVDVLSNLDFKPQCCVEWVDRRDRSKVNRCNAEADHYAVFINSRDAEDHAIACTDCVAQMRHQGVLLRAEPLK